MSHGKYSSKKHFRWSQSSEIFFNDPFKIRSFNFHYANRPSNVVQHNLQSQEPEPKLPKLKTYYKNSKFSKLNQVPVFALSSGIVSGQRRQRTEDDFKYIYTARNNVNNGMCYVNPFQPVDNISLLRISSINDNCKAKCPGQQKVHSSSTCTIKCFKNSDSTSTLTLSTNCNVSEIKTGAQSINIHKLESEEASDKSVRVEMKSNVCLNNNSENSKKLHTLRPCSSECFVIDKRLSKFNLSNVDCCNSLNKDSSAEASLKPNKLRIKSDRRHISRKILTWKKTCMRWCNNKYKRIRQVKKLCELIDLDTKQRNLQQLNLKNHWKKNSKRAFKYDQNQNKKQLTSCNESSSPYVNTDTITNLLYKHAFMGQSSGSIKGESTQNFLITSSSKIIQADVAGGGSRSDLQEYSASQLSHNKLLNHYINGPISFNQPLHIRINKMPIRITTSQTVDDYLQFTISKVFMNNDSPEAGKSDKSIN